METGRSTATSTARLEMVSDLNDLLAGHAGARTNFRRLPAVMEKNGVLRSTRRNIEELIDSWPRAPRRTRG